MAISDIEILDESQRRRFDKLYAKAVAGELSVADIVDDEFFTEVLDLSPHDKNEGKTLLWWAALHKNWQLVNRLINKNADVHTTQFEKMLTQCRKSINKLSDPSNEMVLKVYASEIAKIYNHKR